MPKILYFLPLLFLLQSTCFAQQQKSLQKRDDAKLQKLIRQSIRQENANMRKTITSEDQLRTLNLLDNDSCDQSVQSKKVLKVSLAGKDEILKKNLTAEQISTMRNLDGTTYPSRIAYQKSLSSIFSSNLSPMALDFIANTTLADYNQDSGPQKETFSLIERYLQPSMITGLYGQRDTEKVICQFGYNTLKSDQFLFDPVANANASYDYLLGPGDEIFVYDDFSQDTEMLENNAFTIDSEGYLNIPKVSTIPVTNMNLKELNTTLQGYSKFMRAKLGKLRSIQVNIIGEAEIPGIHRVPGNASVYNIIAITGGVKKTGSLRNIEWRRGTEVLAIIDFYDFLLNGSSLRNSKIQSGDVLFIPIIGPTVAVMGQVHRPAIYEMIQEKSLKEAIKFAGGLLPTADKNRIVVERVKEGQGRVIKSLSYERQGGPQEMIQEFDIIKVFPTPETYRNYYTLLGPFSHTGSFEISEKLTLYKALRQGGQLTAEVHSSRGQIERMDYSKNPDFPERKIISFDLKQVLNQTEMVNFLIENGDLIQIFQKENMVNDIVTIEGKIINAPGDYPFIEGMSIQSLIFRAGGLRSEALDTKVLVYRWEKRENQYTRISIMLNIDPNTFETDPPLILQKGDSIFIQEKPEFRGPFFATINGEVRYPGRYEFIPGEKISSLITKAGGFNNKAFLTGSVFTRKQLQERENAIDQRLKQDVQRSLIRATVEASASLSGTTPTGNVADLYGTIQATQAQPTPEQLNYIQNNPQLLQQYQQYQQNGGATQNPNNVNQFIANLKASQENLESPTNTERLNTEDGTSTLTETNLGRLVIKMKNLDEFKGSVDDLELVDGDSLYIPTVMNSIMIKGETFGQASLPHQGNATAYYYLQALGGPRKLAALEEVYILKPNGLVVQNNLDQYRLEPGDTIVVPPDLTPRESGLKNTAAFVDIIFKTLTTVVLIVKLL